MSDVRIEIRAAVGSGPDRRDDSIQRRRFEGISIGPGGQGAENFGFQILNRENRDARPRRRDSRAPRYFDAVDAGQSDIDDGDVGLMGDDRVDAARTVGRFGDDAQVAGRVEGGA